MRRNQHMNIFEEYNHGDRMPLENNLTRALAITLEENTSFMMLFLDELSERFRDPSLKISGEYEVGIQYNLDNINEIGEIEKIYGLTLTTEKSVFEDGDNGSDEKKEITDIIISIDNYVVIIEVKKNETDATEQLKRQIKKVKDVCKKNGNNYLETDEKSIEWEDIFSILDRYEALKKYDDDRVVRDFSELLYRHLYKCAPIRRFNEIKRNDDNFNAYIDKRIQSIKLEYLNKKGSEDSLEAKRQAIPLNIPYVSECNLLYDGRKDSIDIVMYIGSTGYQYWRFLKSELSGRIFSISNLEYEDGFMVEVNPFIKISSSYARFLNHYKTSEKSIEKYSAIIGRYDLDNKNRWVRQGKDLLVEIRKIVGDKLEGFNGFEEFENDFNKSVEGKTRVLCTTEFCVKVRIPYESAAELDKNDKMVNIIEEAINLIS